MSRAILVVLLIGAGLFAFLSVTRPGCSQEADQAAPPRAEAPAADRQALIAETKRLLENPVVEPPVSAADAAIRKALDEPTVMEFQELPLRDVVEALKDLHEIPIELDETALD